MSAVVSNITWRWVKIEPIQSKRDSKYSVWLEIGLKRLVMVRRSPAYNAMRKSAGLKIVGWILYINKTKSICEIEYDNCQVLKQLAVASCYSVHDSRLRAAVTV